MGFMLQRGSQMIDRRLAIVDVQRGCFEKHVGLSGRQRTLDPSQAGQIVDDQGFHELKARV